MVIVMIFKLLDCLYSYICTLPEAEKMDYLRSAMSRPLPAPGTLKAARWSYMLQPFTAISG